MVMRAGSTRWRSGKAAEPLPSGGVVGGVAGDDDRGRGEALGWGVQAEAGFEQAAGGAEQGRAEQDRDEDREEGGGPVPQGGDGEAEHEISLREGRTTGQVGPGVRRRGRQSAVVRAPRLVLS